MLGVYQATENAGAAYSVITDRLGNVIGLLDDQGHVQGKKSYAAYGEILSETGNISRLGFAGQYDLGDTGILLFEGRPYMPWIGRFMRPDPLGLLGAHFSELYAYGAGDPINNTDPDGRIAIVGAIANVAIGYGIAVASGCEYSVQSAMIDAALGFVGAGLVGKAAKFVKLRQKVFKSKAVIGKVDDLNAPGALKPGENTLLKHLPNQGNPKANWRQNSSVLRREMNKSKPIRDASVKPGGMLRDNTGFLRAERNLLRNKGWTYDSSTSTWSPP